MFFGNSRNAIKKSRRFREPGVSQSNSNYVIAFIDESNPNYTSDPAGNGVGDCWEPDVSRYIQDTVSLGGIPTFLVFDLNPNVAPIWPAGAESASRPPNGEESIIPIARPNPPQSEQEQLIFFNTVVQEMEFRWGTDFWQKIIDDDKSFIIVVDVSGSMTADTVRGAVDLLKAYAAAKGIPSEKISSLESCSQERWLLWGLAGFFDGQDIGCSGNCNTSNLQFCTYTCDGPSSSPCLGNVMGPIPIPKIVIGCDTGLTYEYSCTDYSESCPNTLGPYIWKRWSGIPDCTQSGASDPISCSSASGNGLNGEKVWSPGWVNTDLLTGKMCFRLSLAEKATDIISPIGEPDCGTCSVTTTVDVKVCGCEDFGPVPCGASGGSAGFYKCVECRYTENWRVGAPYNEPWPPPISATGFCGMVACGATDGTYFGEAITFGFAGETSCNGCGEGKTGDCFEAHGGSGCNNTDVCCVVCGGDSFCCDTEWDQICAETALSIIGSDPLDPLKIAAFYSTFVGWTGGDSSLAYFVGLSGYVDINGEYIPCPRIHPTTKFPLHSIVACTSSTEGCTNCASSYGFNGADLVAPWNRCGIVC